MTAVIEPGLLNLFRWYVGIRLGFLVLAAVAMNSDNPPSPPHYPQVGIVLFGFLLILLLVPWFRTSMGRAFLPATITLAAIAPIVDAARTVTGRLDAGLSPNDALADYWIPFFLLFVPFVLIVWEYRYRWVLVFAVASTVVEAVVLAGIFETYSDRLVDYNIDLSVIGAILVGRGFLFAFVGFFITKLVARQREASEELRALAATTEQLATERERTRIARELHDTLAHAMTGTVIQLEAAEALWSVDPDRALEHVDRALVGTRSGLAEARRAIDNLRASPIDDLGLAGALNWLADETTATSGIPTTAVVSGSSARSLQPDLEHAAFRVTEEAVANAVRHGDPSHITITADLGSTVSVSVADDGSGFDPELVETGRHGLVGIRERATLVRGAVDIETSVGGGTTVRFTAPGESS
ncbi:MAG: sensor histidine kinase [Armatimonadetes bacterium]|nr:MAG: sensor histidine kinase [Armatimonadota bacterium]